MRILGVDVETTGLDTTQDRITEIGFVLWDTELKAPLQSASYLVNDPDIVEIKPEVEQLTGITVRQLREFGVARDEAFDTLLSAARNASAIAAHNGTEFDRKFIERQCEKFSIPWIDTLTDVPYPDSIKTRNLLHLAAEHGFVNPFRHRVAFDVFTMLLILSQYDLQEVMRLAQSPAVIVKASVSYDDRQKAKDQHYRWEKIGDNGKVFPKLFRAGTRAVRVSNHGGGLEMPKKKTDEEQLGELVQKMSFARAEAAFRLLKSFATKTEPRIRKPKPVAVEAKTA